ncbi:replication initiator [Subtercola boreus]|uniref:replication initiator n=1 Tax=Subtercola boreus TaxID=120213 RepID=UPI001150C499|nr:replication initiator [Subtercola boreus]TQL55043.1 hypothetical protein FB464_2598 [Subtercola boreus]
MAINHINYRDRLALLLEPDFLSSAADEGVDPRVAAGLVGLTRADRCTRPLVSKRSVLDSGRHDPAMRGKPVDEPESFLIPCSTSDADKCEPCAEFRKQLSMRQMLTTLSRDGSAAALFTLTAPSFGRVHSSYWTAKDEFRSRHLPDTEREAKRLYRKQFASPCPCSGFHTSSEGIAGTPVNPNTYDYAAEIIWNANLPALVSSMKRKVKTMAKTAGIDLQNFRMFIVYERQVRGALHTHVLLACEGNAPAFAALVEAIDLSWNVTPPTAEIPDELVTWLRTDAAQKLAEDALDYVHGRPLVKDSIPVASWKGGAPRPATMFGSQYDIRVISAKEPEAPHTTGDPDDAAAAAAEAEDMPDVDSHSAAAAYLAKYLTKNQSAFSPAALRRTQALLRAHYARFRRLAFALLADRAVLHSRRATATKTLTASLQKWADDKQANRHAPPLAPEPDDMIHRLRKEAIPPVIERDRPDREPPGIRLLRAEIEELKNAPIAPNPLTEAVSPLMSSHLTRKELVRCLTVTGDLVSLRGIRTRLNRVADNGGFTGTLTSASNWGCSLTSLKEEMRAWAEAMFAPEVPVDPDDFIIVWEIDMQASEEEFERRKPSPTE